MGPIFSAWRSRSMVDRHGGRLDIETERGRGTRIRLEFAAGVEAPGSGLRLDRSAHHQTTWSATIAR